MKIEILLFAAARDAVGKSILAIDLPDGSTVADLKRQLSQAEIGLTDLVGRSAFSVDQKYADGQTVIRAGQEIAMIPPVSGG